MKNSILFLFLLFSFLLVLPFTSSLHFNISRFSPDDHRIAYQGDAAPNGAIEFNNAAFTCRVGWATYAKKVLIWDPKTKKAADFTTSFTFKIDTGRNNFTNYGHGLSFFLAPAGISLFPNSAGGFLGLFNETNGHTSRFPLVHIEFDTFYNLEWDPLDGQSHVGINNNSLASSTYTSWNATLHSQDTCHARISYVSSTKNLSISWSYEETSNPQEISSLSYIIDLTKVLPSEVTIGFSGATGAKMEAHRLFSWEFNSSLETRESTPNKTKVKVGVSISSVFLLTSSVFAFAMFWKRKQRKEKKTEENLTDLERGAGPRRFSYKDLVSATNNFFSERKLGEGGFGAVYKGYLSDLDLMVAVKKFSGGASKQGKREFITEVKIISSLRHRNLVQLIGWCHEKEELLLVYEFMPNGSLDSHLFGKKKTNLSWAVRCKISLGVASALLYLHEEWEQCIVHRDIKTSNIILDSNFNAKLGDFGLARLMDHELGPQTTGLAGTFGYMAPEYISTGRASKESDVYSFGVVLLEIVTGKKSVDGRGRDFEELEASLVEKVWDLNGRGEVISAVDHQMGKDYDMVQAECVMVVGLWCAHPDVNSRPSIRQAIQVLNFEAPLPNLPPKMPVATYHNHAVASSSSSSGSGLGGVVLGN